MVLVTPTLEHIVIALFAVEIGAYVPGATRIVSPADEASIAACIVAFGADSLVPELESEPVEPFTYHVVANAIIGISKAVNTSFRIIPYLSFCRLLPDAARPDGSSGASCFRLTDIEAAVETSAPPAKHQDMCVGYSVSYASL